MQINGSGLHNVPKMYSKLHRGEETWNVTVNSAPLTFYTAFQRQNMLLFHLADTNSDIKNKMRH